LYLKLDKDQREKLEYIEIPHRARLDFTRIIRGVVQNDDPAISLIHKNSIIAIAHSVMGRPIYTLEAEGGDYYYPSEYAWHNGEFERIFFRPFTPDLVEILCDLLNEKYIEYEAINKIFTDNQVSITFEYNTYEETYSIHLFNDLFLDEEIPLQDTKSENVLQLIDRMNRSLENADYPAVLHASASVFETLAKATLDNDKLKNKTFSKLYTKFRAKTKLSDFYTEKMFEIYKKRGSEPLSGHGHTEKSTLRIEEAIEIAEFTKMIVRIYIKFKSI